MMKHRILIIFSLVFVVILFAPLFIYLWGLSNINSDLVFSSLVLNEEQKIQTWEHAKEYGATPKVESITPYGYIMYFYCHTHNGINSIKCAEAYPGLKVATLAIRNIIRRNIEKFPSNLKWQITWVSYSIWVTRNWNIQQILSTYYEEYGNEYSA